MVFAILKRNPTERMRFHYEFLNLDKVLLSLFYQVYGSYLSNVLKIEFVEEEQSVLKNSECRKVIPKTQQKINTLQPKKRINDDQS